MRGFAYIGVVLLLTGLATSVASGDIYNKNLIVNGDFEQGRLGQLPPGWGKAHWTLFGHETWERKVVRQPSKSSDLGAYEKSDLCVNRSDTHNGRGGLEIRNQGRIIKSIFQKVPVEPGARYRLSWYSKTDGRIGGELQVNVANKGEPRWWAGQGLANKTFGAGLWTAYAVEFVVPLASNDQVYVGIRPTGYQVKDTWIRVDDMVLEKIAVTGAAGLREAAKDHLLPKGNMVHNGGFEFGLTTGWYSGQSSIIEHNYEIDATNPYEGRVCAVRQPRAMRGARIMSNWSYAEPGQHYYLSLALRGSFEEQEVNFGFAHTDPNIAHRGGIWTKYPNITVKLTRGWQIFNLDRFIPKDLRFKRVHVHVSPRGQEPVYIDAVRLTRGARADEKVKANDAVGVEVQIHAPQFGNIFKYNQPGYISLIARNVGEWNRTITVEYKITDPFDAVYQHDCYKVELNPGRSIRRRIEVDTNRRGRFDLTVKIRDEQDKLIRKTWHGFAVLKPVRPRHDGPLAIMVRTGKFNVQDDARCFNDALGLLGRHGLAWVRNWWTITHALPGRHQITSVGDRRQMIMSTDMEKLDWRQFDLELTAIEDAGMKLMPCLHPGSVEGPHFSGVITDREPGTPLFWPQWLRFVEAAVRRYKDRIDMWEVINEPALTHPEWRTHYYLALKSMHSVIKRIDPTATVSGCGHVTSPTEMAGLKDFIEKGGLNYCDIIGLHPYDVQGIPIWGNLQGKIDTIRTQARVAGFDHRVQSTEMSFWSPKGGYLYESDGLDHARLMVQNWLIFWKNRGRSFYFASELGIIENHNIFEPGPVPHAIFCAMNTLAEYVQGNHFPEWAEIPTELGGIWGMQFDREKGSGHQADVVLTLWTVGAPERRVLALPIQNGEASLMDMFGNPLDLQYQDGGILFEVTQYPSYLSIPGVTGDQLNDALTAMTQLSAFEKDRSELVGMTRPGEMFVATTLFMPESAQEPPPPAGPFTPDSEGFIRDWLIMGPFANVVLGGPGIGYDHDFLKPINGEAIVRLRLGSSVHYEFPQGRTEWGHSEPKGFIEVKARPYRSPTSRVNFQGHMSPDHYVVAYAYCHVIVPQTTKAILSVGNDDAMKVWLNGVKVVERRIYDADFPDQGAVEVQLKAGENRLMVKLDQAGGRWGFFLRFLDSQAPLPVTGSRERPNKGKPLSPLTVGW